MSQCNHVSYSWVFDPFHHECSGEIRPACIDWSTYISWQSQHTWHGGAYPGPQSNSTFLCWWKNGDMGCTGTSSSSPRCSYSSWSSQERGSAQSTWPANGSLFCNSILLPQQRAGKLQGAEFCSLGNAFLSQSYLVKHKGWGDSGGSNTPVPALWPGQSLFLPAV